MARSSAETELSKPLEFTGERFTPECVREIWYEHYHRYVFAREHVAGLKVLDAACGEGYGSYILASVAASVKGVDVSGQAIDHARTRYAAGNLEFVVSDCLELPFGDDEVDCLVSFETLEHLEDHERLMTEFRRVLKPGGFLMISSPDKAIYTDKLQNRNEFHLRELYRDEFEGLLRAHFPAYRLWGQKLLFQSAIWALKDQPGVSFQQEDAGEFESLSRPRHEPVYFIALCAADECCLPKGETGLSLFDDSGESVYEHYYHEIRNNMAAGKKLAKLDRELADLKRALEQGRRGPNWWNRLLGRR
jgi:SAM-dependent methyltransferase